MKLIFWLLSCCCGLSVCAQIALDSVRYNQVFAIATHNSYWVKRAYFPEPFATGTQQRLLDQLLFDNVRGLEIDIHKTRKQPGMWSVYHTGRSKNSFFNSFTDFLKQLQQFDYALPQHEVVTVIIELKEIFEKNFDKKHTPADFDRLLKSYLGHSLFTPSDLLARCPGKETLEDCVKSSPEIWPTIQELRGQFIFVVLGNFHWNGIGHGGQGWVTYANSTNPVAFPMQSDFSLFNTGKPMSEKIDSVLLSKAYSNSVFQQVEILTDKKHLQNVAEFIDSGGIVRGGNSFSLPEQQDRIACGFHLLQTDFPWLSYQREKNNQPFHLIDTNRIVGKESLTEPGNRIFVSHGQANVFTIFSDSSADWETLPTSTRISPDNNYKNPKAAYGKGCLFARGDSQNFIRICRKVNSEQNAEIIIEEKFKGISSKLSFTSNDNSSGIVGDYIRMQVTKNPVGGGSCVSVFSSSEMMNNKSPLWNLLKQSCFNVALREQGISASEGDVLFTGTKKNGIDITEDSVNNSVYK